MKITKQQRIDWFLAKKCHVCGSDQPHDHPNWMWMANPVPELPSEVPEERKRMAEIENEISKVQLSKIIGRELKEDVKTKTT